MSYAGDPLHHSAGMPAPRASAQTRCIPIPDHRAADGQAADVLVTAAHW
jgi:hypothetical protein